MKRSERIIAALLTMAIGVLLIAIKDNFIGILMTVAGICLIVLGVVDICNNAVPPAIVKVAVGILIIICGWAAVQAVLYIVSAILLILGILLLHDKIKNGVRCTAFINRICEFAVPSICIAIGILLLFHRVASANFIFITTGIFVLLDGGLLLFNSLSEN